MHPEMTTTSLIFTENSLINNKHLDSVQKCDLETKSWDQNMCFEVQTNFGGILKARKQIWVLPVAAVHQKEMGLLESPITYYQSVLKR